jgi:hypothetical protein
MKGHPLILLSLFVLAFARSLARNTAIADDHHQKHPTLSEARLLGYNHPPRLTRLARPLLFPPFDACYQLIFVSSG